MSATIILRGSANGQISLRSAANVTPNLALVLPATDGSAGQVLATDGSGTLSFVTNDGTASFQTANSAASYANGAFAVANTLFDGTADANLSSLIVNTIIVNSIGSNNGEGAGFLNLSQNDTRLGNDVGDVKLSVMNQETSRSYYVTLANTDGSLTLSGNLYANSNTIITNEIIANTVTSVNVISSNEITANNITIANNFIVSNVAIQWHTPPLTSKGSVGDKAGWIAVDDDKIYRCTTDYTDGNADIWVYVNFTGGTWG